MTIRLSRADRAPLLSHFMSLGRDDRRLRFGAPIQDEGLRAYVARIDFARDGVFAVHDDELRIVGAMHVARSANAAELGLSVLAGWRQRGLGDALLKRAVAWLRNRGVLLAYVHCLSENAAMMHLARKNGMRIVYSGGESDGRLELARPTPESVFDEWVEDRYATWAHTIRTQGRGARALPSPQRIS